jgi:hypothetical protein
MHIEDGGLVFDKPDELPGILNVFEGDAAIHLAEDINLYLNLDGTGVQPYGTHLIVSSLHDVITDSRLTESRREEATNQIMFIALTALKSTEVYDTRLREAEMRLRSRPRPAQSFGDAVFKG